MLWVFTGARRMPLRTGAGLVMPAVYFLPKGSTVAQGGCVGVDAVAAMYARRRGLSVHTVLPANRLLVAADWRDWTDTYEALPPGTTYRARNERLVAIADRVLAFPLHAEHDPRSQRSGTWQTVRLARAARKPVEVYVLTPGEED